MVLKTSDSYLKVKTIYSLIITYLEDKEVIDNGWFKPKTVNVSNSYRLTLRYLGEDDNTTTTWWSCPTKEPLEKLYESLVEQIRMQDGEYADRLLEDAIINGGKK